MRISDWSSDVCSSDLPDRADKVMHMVQDIRGGRDNDAQFFTRMRGHGVWAQLIRTRVKRAAREHGMDRSFPPIRSDLFRPPERDEIGRAHVRTPVTNAQLVCRLLLEKQKE